MLSHITTSQVSTKDVSTTISAFADAEEVFGYIQQLHSAGFKPNAAHFASAIRSCAKVRSWQRALALFNLMAEWRVERDVVVHNAALTACRGGSRWELALALLPPGRTTVSYNSAISAMGASAQWHLALALLAEVSLQRLQTSSITYSSSIGACEAASAWQSALEVFAATPQSFLGDAVPRALLAAKVASWATAVDVVNKAKAGGVQTDASFWNAAAAACKASWQTSLAICPSNKEAARSFNEGYCWQASMAILDLLPGKGMASPDAAARAECWAAALGILWHTGAEPSMSDLNSVAVALEKQGMEEAVQDLLLRGFQNRLRRRPYAPRSFVAKAQERLGRRASVRQLLRSAAREPKRTVRLNLGRADEGLLQQLHADGWAPQPLPWCADAFVVHGESLGHHQAHLSGQLYFQEPTSMIPPLALQEALDAKKPGQYVRVLDLCAAPGSKASQLAIWLHNRPGGGLLVANEPSEERAEKLRTNLLRSGVVNVLVTVMDGREMDALVPESFDAILLDAPCSCEGNIRKEPIALLRGAASSGPKNPLVLKQQELLHSAWHALSPGGCLVYSTCTFDEWQNEIQCRRFLEALDDVEVLQTAALEGSMLRVWPHHWDTEGFFVSAFQKCEKDMQEDVQETSEPEAPRGFCQLSQEQRWEVQRLVKEFGISPKTMVSGPQSEVWMLPELGKLEKLRQRAREPGLLLTRQDEASAELRLVAGAPLKNSARGWASLLADVEGSLSMLNMYLDLCASEGDLQAAQRVYQDMLRRGLKPDRMTRRSLAKARRRERNPETRKS
ncbi:unnamed protein product, partial [Cladocopium goreaui]